LGSYYSSPVNTTSPIANGQIIGNITIGSPGIYIVTAYGQLYLTTANALASAVMGVPIVGSVGYSSAYGSGGLYQSAFASFYLVVTSNYSVDVTLGGNFIVGNIRSSGITFNYSYLRIA
jgi:hypothetical protein